MGSTQHKAMFGYHGTAWDVAAGLMTFKQNCVRWKANQST
jgi:hypothetical protein